MDEGALEVERLSLTELCEGNLLYWGTPKDILSKALEIGVCFSRGLAFGEHGGTLLS